MTRLRQQANLLVAAGLRSLNQRQWERDELGRFASAPDESFKTICEYWRDPEPFKAEQAANRATASAAIDAAVRVKLRAAGLVD